MTCSYAFMTALFGALIVVPVLRQWALDRGETDAPDARKVHTAPMPRLGGIGIFLAFLFAAIVFVPVDATVRGMLAGSLIIFALGVIDDLVGLSSKRKFAGQILASLATITISGLYLTSLGNLFGFGEILLPAWLGIPFTVFAVVGVTNAINLIDGLDGLAGGLSVIALAAFLLLGMLEGDLTVMLLAAALIGAILGFLKYNFYPARIFMGDTGSLVVGYLLGFLAVHLTQQPGTTIRPMVPVLILGLPLLDTVWVMSRRLLKGMSPFAPDRSHLHHKFLDLGFAHRFTVIIIYGISLFWACVALLLRQFPGYLLLLIYLVTVLSCYVMLRHVHRHQERFPFLNRDSAVSLRNSVTYQQICAWLDALLPAVRGLFGLFLLLTAWSLLQESVLSWQLPLGLLLIGVYLWFRPIADNRQFLMMVVYAAMALALTQIWLADHQLLGGLALKRAVDLLLGATCTWAVLKFLFHRYGEFFLSTADFLVLAICAFVAVAAQQGVLDLAVNAPLLRIVAAIITLRVIIAQSRRNRDIVIVGAFGFLAMAVLIGFIGG